MENDNQSELEKALIYGIHGEPQLKKGERLYFLDQFRERVIFALTEKEVRQGKKPEGLKKALEDERAKTLIIKGDMDVKTILEYEHLADEYGVHSKTVSNPDFKGDIGLVVVSDRAVDLPDREIYSLLPSHLTDA